MLTTKIKNEMLVYYLIAKTNITLKIQKTKQCEYVDALEAVFKEE